jgi:hypothetical protein
MRRATDLRAAPHAGVAFTFIDLPEPFEGVAVRESLFKIETAPNVLHGKLQHFANGFVQARDPFCR